MTRAVEAVRVQEMGRSKQVGVSCGWVLGGGLVLTRLVLVLCCATCRYRHSDIQRLLVLGYSCTR